MTKQIYRGYDVEYNGRGQWFVTLNGALIGSYANEEAAYNAIDQHRRAKAI
jgi:hypothetical protein